jgi:hypothetical protein
MSPVTPKSEMRVLRRCWRRWCAVVELFAGRRLGRRGVDAAKYRAVYDELLRTCRVLEQEAGGADRAFYGHIGRIVQPWMSVEALARADTQILASLVNDCRSAERRLGVRRAPAWLRRWVVLALVLFAGAAACALVRDVGEPVRDVWQRLRAALGSLSDVQKVFLMGLTVAAVSMALVSRIRRGG